MDSDRTREFFHTLVAQVVEGIDKEQEEQLLRKPYFQSLKESGILQGSPGSQNR